jgi:hypothetical protein
MRLWTETCHLNELIRLWAKHAILVNNAVMGRPAILMN